jgi:hypothetical protein
VNSYPESEENSVVQQSMRCSKDVTKPIPNWHIALKMAQKGNS